MRPQSCRRCYATATGCDVTRLSADNLSYAAVTLGHTPASLAGLVHELEQKHILGVTVYCPRCSRVGLSVATLPEQAGTPEVCEMIRQAYETKQLHDLMITL